jgi:starvation-inducible DNA-binding protein
MTISEPQSLSTHHVEALQTHPSLSEHERHEIGNQLQSALVELIDLSLIGKQLHWNVVGPDFRSLHLQLDELVDSWRELGDTVAERAVALGVPPDGRSSTVAAGTEFRQLEPGPLSDRAVVHHLTERLMAVVDRMRTRMERVGELDAASEDVLIDVVRELEKQLWMVRVQAG